MGVTRSVLLCLVLIAFSSGACYSKKQTAAPGNTGFAVVELFTSEGCSSCPAAERVLSQLQNEHLQNVYVMEFHIDYWNDLGWKDVYSSAEYTKRQQHYAGAFNLSSTYTPQAIVNGRYQLVGSDERKLFGLVKEGNHTQPMNTIGVAASIKDNSIQVKYTIANIKGQLLNIALVQKQAETNVKNGENSGRKLTHINVVRALKTIDALAQGSMFLPLPDGLLAKDVAVVVYTQSKATLEVTGAIDARVN